MTELHTLQSQFQNYLTHGNIDPLLAQIAPSNTFAANRRLAVYFDAYRIRLHEILQLDFPKVRILMGEDNFRKAFVEYLTEYPSRHFSVRYFGQFFPDFLEKHADFSDYPFLAEMAQFEWALNHTLDAADASILTLPMLSSIPPDRWYKLTFSLHPSVVWRDFSWNVPALWKAIDNDEPPRLPTISPFPVLWLCCRKGLRSLFHSCTPAEQCLFKALQAGGDFSEMCASLIDIVHEADIPRIAAQALHQWVQEELLKS